MTEQSLIAQCKRAVLALGWRHPFFLPGAGRVSFVSAPVTTAAVDLRGRIFVDPAYAATVSATRLQATLAHELCHLYLLHHARRGGRDPWRWNVATDKAINAILKAIGLDVGPDWLYPTQDNTKKSAEALYSEEAAPSSSPTPSVGQGCGPTAPQSDEEEGITATPTPQQAEREWRELAAQARSLAATCGTAEGRALAGLLDIPPARIRWDQVLRGAMSRAVLARGYDDTTYSRRSRRTQGDGPIFPGGIRRSARVAVVIDTSGSMSDEDLGRAVANTIAICRSLRVSVYLVTHDACVQWSGWISATGPAAKVQAACTGRGGTVFEPAYQAVEDAGRFDALVHLTDGEVYRWPAKPSTCRRLVVALLGTGNQAAVPAEAKVIETELS